jgi:hypothetical protein
MVEHMKMASVPSVPGAPGHIPSRGGRQERVRRGRIFFLVLSSAAATLACMVSITRQQVREIHAESYRVTDTVTEAIGIPAEIYVHDVGTAQFSHVATVFDLQALAVNAAPGSTHYRASVATRTCADVASARDFAAGIAPRVRSLIKAYDAVVNGFLGTDSETITNE